MISSPWDSLLVKINRPCLEYLIRRRSLSRLKDTSARNVIKKSTTSELRWMLAKQELVRQLKLFLMVRVLLEANGDSTSSASVSISASSRWTSFICRPLTSRGQCKRWLEWQDRMSIWFWIPFSLHWVKNTFLVTYRWQGLLFRPDYSVDSFPGSTLESQTANSMKRIRLRSTWLMTFSGQLGVKASESERITRMPIALKRIHKLFGMENIRFTLSLIQVRLTS